LRLHFTLHQKSALIIMEKFQQQQIGFIKGRLRGIQIALKGMWQLIRSEDSIKAQLVIALGVSLAGVYFQISSTEWLFQCSIIGLVLVAESLNTAIEEMADFTHPAFHSKIGSIKDIAAGAVSFAALTATIIAGIIYFPKIAILFQ